MLRLLALAALAVTLAACGTPRMAAPTSTAPAAAPTAASTTTGTLRVDLVAPSDSGPLLVGLYASAATFLREPDRTARATSSDRHATVTFEGLAPGRYAVSVFQDLDGNDEIEMGAMGPTEPYGFSGDPGGQMMGPPQFDTSSVEVEAGAEATVTVTLRQTSF